MGSTEREELRIAMIAAAEGVLNGRFGIIEGCRLLHALSVDLVPYGSDVDLNVFNAVDSETDALPMGSVRQYWSPAALQREDEKIKRAEAMYRDEVMSACRNVINRFKDVQF